MRFSDAEMTVALDQPVSDPLGRPVRLTVGVGRAQESGLWAAVTGTSRAPDGRSCLVLRIVDGRGGGRRDVARVPFDAKVDVLVVSSRANVEPRLRASALDLSTGGMALLLDRELPPGTTLLLRFAVPPNRGATAQVRGTVVSCRPEADGTVAHGIAFERVSGTVAQQLQLAVRAISDGR